MIFIKSSPKKISWYDINDDLKFNRESRDVAEDFIRTMIVRKQKFEELGDEDILGLEMQLFVANCKKMKSVRM